jgi:hypothetical protein
MGIEKIKEKISKTIDNYLKVINKINSDFEEGSRLNHELTQAKNLHYMWKVEYLGAKRDLITDVYKNRSSSESIQEIKNNINKYLY